MQKKQVEKVIPIACTSSHLVEIEQLKPIQGKLKNRTREQLYSLRSLIIKYGFSFPIYIWQDGENLFTLDGHGRDYICKELAQEGYKFQQKDGTIDLRLPAVFVDAKDKSEAKEKLLALNSSFGEITDEGLFAFIFENGAEVNFNEIKEYLELPNINLDKFEEEYLSNMGDEEEEKYRFIFSQEQLKTAVKEHFPNFESTEDIIKRIIDYPLAMHQFNRLCSGAKNVGSDISLLFNPHRLETKINNRKLSASEAFIKKDRGMLSSLSQWITKQKEVVHHNFYINTAKVGTGTQIAHEFKPFLARQIYLDYCGLGAKVLDPCAGWGGRMLGFSSALIGGEYLATDPSTKTFQGLLKLKDFILSSEITERPEIKLNNLPFEDLELPERYFDFAFTSPPYFDTEIYTDEETQAYNRYKTLDEFNEKFLKELILKTLKSLKKGKILLLNIGGSQYKFNEIVHKICSDNNLNIKEIFKYKIGKGDKFVQKFNGDVMENSLKANDLFFEISE